MTKLNEYSEQPGYDSVASAHSKAQIFLFIGMSVFKFFSVDYSVGILWGALFVVIGMFVVSILVAAPMLFLKLKTPALSGLFDVFGSGLTLVLTYLAFDFLLGP
jgi:hypothetical protein